MGLLDQYNEKRDFDATPEPAGAPRKSGSEPLRFVVQLHDATRRHYDVRLEVDGVLKSWAVPKGPSALPADKRLAMMTEDHPFDYRTFEGVIPKGNYGAGPMVIWDEGTYVPVDGKTRDDPVEEDPKRGNELMRGQLEKGEVKVEFRGHKLKGRWALIHTGGRGRSQDPNAWLMVKDRDEHARETSGPPGDDRSVVSGRSLAEVIHPAPVRVTETEIEAAIEAVRRARATEASIELAAGRVKLTNLDKEFWPKQGKRRALTKRDLILYLIQVAPHILRHVADRPVALTRYPDGAFGKFFYQKDRPPGTPEFVRGIRVHSGTREGEIEYLLISSLGDLVWLGQMGALEIHPWISRITPPEPGDARFTTKFDGSKTALDRSALNYPDFLLFDIDPYVYSGKEAKGAEPELHRQRFRFGVEGAFLLKEMLDSLDLPSYVKTSGKTGIHIHVPILRQFTYKAVRAMVETFVNQLVALHPDRFTREWQIEKRRGKIFLDINQNVRGKNMAMLLCPRPTADASVSMPVTWDQLRACYPTDFTIETAPALMAERRDPWLGIMADKRDLSALIEE